MEIKIFLALFAISVSANTLDKFLYTTEHYLYTAKHDIVNIHAPMRHEMKMFLVEKDLSDGSFKGLYAFNIPDKRHGNIVATKVLDNGQCTTSDKNTVYFGASDGIYTYNYSTNEPEKYGTIKSDIKAIQKHTKEDIIYVITNNKLNKVTEKGTKMEEIESISGVQDIVIDKNNNIYFYEEKNANAREFHERYGKPKVLVGDSVVEMTGLPDKYSQMILTTSYICLEEAQLVLDNQIYILYPNGTVNNSRMVYENAPTASFVDFAVMQFFAHAKKLYRVLIPIGEDKDWLHCERMPTH